MQYVTTGIANKFELVYILYYIAKAILCICSWNSLLSFPMKLGNGIALFDSFLSFCFVRYFILHIYLNGVVDHPALCSHYLLHSIVVHSM